MASNALRLVAAFCSLVVTTAASAAVESTHTPPSLGPAAAWFADYLKNSRPVPIGGGRSLNLDCVGSGSPTVILESGLTESAFSWWKVQGALAKDKRVCAYDRAGMGKSPPGPFPRDTKAQVADLEALVKAAKLKGPYVLVGHSAGGYNVRLFASRHLRDIAGIVFVDSSVENQLEHEKLMPKVAENDARSYRRIKACADPGRTEEIAGYCTRKAPDDFPPDLANAYQSMFSLSTMQTILSEMDSFKDRDSAQIVAESRRFGSLPLIVLTRGNLSSDLPPDQAQLEWKLWNEGHDKKLASLSTIGINRKVEGSGHYIQIDKPEAVIAAVEEVVAKARSGRARAGRTS